MSLFDGFEADQGRAVQARLDEMLELLAQDLDIPPATAFQFEGMLHLISAEKADEAQQRLATEISEYCGLKLSGQEASLCVEFIEHRPPDRRLQLYIQYPEAPVYRS